MKARHLAAVVGMAGLMALGSGPVWASGGLDSGGSGGSGGGGGGGTTTVTTAPAPSSCAQFSSFSNTTGYYAVWAAIWTSFSIANSCGSPVNWQVTFTNGNT